MIEKSKELINDDVYYFSLTAGSDFVLNQKSKVKISSKEEITINLIPAPKIISELRKYNQNFKVIGFKLSDDINDSIKLMRKYNLDYVVYNSLDTISSNNVNATLISNTNSIDIHGSKSEVSYKIIKEVFKYN